MGIRLTGTALVLDAPAHQRLVNALRSLLAECRFTTLAQLGAVLRPSRSKTWLSDLCRGHHLPAVHELRAVVLACAPSAWPDLHDLLVAAHGEATSRAAAVPLRLADLAVTGSTARWPIVGKFDDWEVLGVHRPITRLSNGEDLTDRLLRAGLPAYVLRETDLAPDGLRSTLAAVAAGSTTRLVLISGDSAAGKTRAAAEAMRVVLPTWRLLLPHGANELKDLLDQHPELSHVVVWLDEIQNFLHDPGGVTQVRRLLATTGGPTLLLATLRTDREDALRGSAGWDLLDRRAHRVVLHRRPHRDQFERELARARKLADPWIVEALSLIGDRYGIAECLAAGPQLLRELDRARTRPAGSIARVGAAIVDAAVDCYRGGYTYPVPNSLLREAHQLYLDFPAQPSADGLFAEALAWARQPVAGAVGMIEHLHRRGDHAFDYLLDDAARPGGRPLEPEIWNFLLRHTTAKTLLSIALAAHRNGDLTTVKIAQSRMITADLQSFSKRTGNSFDVSPVAAADEDQDDLEALTVRADKGDRSAAWSLAILLRKQGGTVTLTARADCGDESAAGVLAGLLRDRRDLGTLVQRADSGDPYAARALAYLLGQRGDVVALTRRADAGEPGAISELAGLLGDRGDVETLTRRADCRDQDAAEVLAGLLGNRDDVEALRKRVATGDLFASNVLANLLSRRDDLSDLTRQADAGDANAGDLLARLLRDRGELATLGQRADAGDVAASSAFAHHLRDRGDVAGLFSRAVTGDQQAVICLVEMLADRHDVEGLTRLVDTGDTYAIFVLDGLLHENADIETLSRRAESGDHYAMNELAALARARGVRDLLASNS